MIGAILSKQLNTWKMLNYFENLPAIEKVAINERTYNFWRYTKRKDYEAQNIEPELVAWLTNQYADWQLYALAQWELDWLTEKGQDCSLIYRTCSWNGHFNLMRVTPKGWVQFMDGEHLTNTDEVQWNQAWKPTGVVLYSK